MEGWQSGRMRRTRNPVYGYTVSRVRIPPLPPGTFAGHCKKRKSAVDFFLKFLKIALLEKFEQECASSSVGLEYLATNQGVVGSNPAWRTIKLPGNLRICRVSFCQGLCPHCVMLWRSRLRQKDHSFRKNCGPLFSSSQKLC